MFKQLLIAKPIQKLAGLRPLAWLFKLFKWKILDAEKLWSYLPNKLEESTFLSLMAIVKLSNFTLR
jgi:hypothetical protein